MAFHSGILARKFHGQRSLADYGPWSCKEADTTEHTHEVPGAIVTQPLAASFLLLCFHVTHLCLHHWATWSRRVFFNFSGPPSHFFKALSLSTCFLITTETNDHKFSALKTTQMPFFSSKRPDMTSKNSSLFTWLENPTKSRKWRGSNLCVHVKNTCETAQAIEDVHIRNATKYLKDITFKKQCVSFCHYNAEAGRYAQAK